MNILIDRLPSSVEVGGRLYAIDTSYTTSIRFENLMLDDTIDGRHKLLLALNLYLQTTKETRRSSGWYLTERQWMWRGVILYIALLRFLTAHRLDMEAGTLE